MIGSHSLHAAESDQCVSQIALPFAAVAFVLQYQATLQILFSSSIKQLYDLALQAPLSIIKSSARPLSGTSDLRRVCQSGKWYKAHHVISWSLNHVTIGVTFQPD